MCGRVSLKATPPELGEFTRKFDAKKIGDWYEQRWNIAPSSQVVTILQDDDVRYTLARKWGFVWAYSRDSSSGHHIAKAETVATLKSFKDAFRRRRCLVVVDSFYEWQKPLDAKKATQPFRVHLPTNEPFLLAGIWERWGDPMDSLETCAIITTKASEWMFPIHHRMPVVIPANAGDAWLDPRTSVEQAEEIMANNVKELAAYPVTRYVNSPRNEGPKCWEPELETA
jgi:putative SOS response-associated peptidase YedK